MKTNLPKIILFLSSLMGFTVQADEVACLRDLLPVTDKASFRKERKGFEQPFLAGNGKFVVIPEVKANKLTGFFVYGQKKSRYYDTAQVTVKKSRKQTALTELKPGPVYNLVAQPDGLETVSIAYAPHLKEPSNRTPSSAALGASMLPVVGALADLQKRDTEPLQYIAPPPPSAEDEPRKLVQMATTHGKSLDQIMQPLQSELKLRFAWIRSANIDDSTFKDLNRILASSCQGMY